MSRYSSSDCKVYIGDLGTAGNKNEIEDAFSEYGKLRSVWVARNPPGFAFVEFEDPRDAEDAVRGLDGRTLCGRRVRVELSTGRKRDRGSDRNGPARGGRGPPRSEERCYECGERGHFARDCRRRNYRGRSRSRSRSRSRRSRSRSESRSKSRSASREKRSPPSRSRSRSRSGSRNVDE